MITDFLKKLHTTRTVFFFVLLKKKPENPANKLLFEMLSLKKDYNKTIILFSIEFSMMENRETTLYFFSLFSYLILHLLC